MRYVTREEIREIDRIAIEDYGMPGVILMENAGRGAAEHALEMLGGSSTLPGLRRAQSSRAVSLSSRKRDPHVCIICGAGNNGGDGFVVARHLHNRGVGLTVQLLAPRDKIRGDALINLEIVEKMHLYIRRPVAELAEGGTARPQRGRLQRAEHTGLDFSKSDLIVDAMFGTGLAGEVREPFLSAIRAVNAAGRPVLAIDIPSGLDANTGLVLGECVWATRTVTFALPKIGFTQNSGPEMAGEVVVADIGVPSELLISPKA